VRHVEDLTAISFPTPGALSVGSLKVTPPTYRPDSQLGNLTDAAGLIADLYGEIGLCLGVFDKSLTMTEKEDEPWVQMTGRFRARLCGQGAS